MVATDGCAGALVARERDGHIDRRRAAAPESRQLRTIPKHEEDPSRPHERIQWHDSLP